MLKIKRKLIDFEFFEKLINCVCEGTIATWFNFHIVVGLGFYSFFIFLFIL